MTTQKFITKTLSTIFLFGLLATSFFTINTESFVAELKASAVAKDLTEGKAYLSDAVLIKTKNGVSINDSEGKMSLQGQFNKTETEAVVYRLGEGESVEGSLVKLLQNEDVEIAQPIYKYTTFDYTPNDPEYANQWYLKEQGSGIKLPSAWEYLGTKKGVVCGDGDASARKCSGETGVKVAVIDTGINIALSDFADSHFDNTNSMMFFNNDDSTCPSPSVEYTLIDDIRFCQRIGYQEDPVGHGSAVAQVITMSDNSVGGVGVASNVTILPIALHKDALNSYFISESIDYAINHGVKVVNLSMGTSTVDPYLEYTLQKAVDAGLIVVTSSGNCAEKTAQGCFGFADLDDIDLNPAVYPATSDYAIAVGASNAASNYVSYSSYGSHIDVVAPVGEEVDTTGGVVAQCGVVGAGGYCEGKAEGDFAKFYGTSYSAPQVSGVIALMASINPNINFDNVRDIFIATADDINTVGFDERTGYGLVNTFEALSDVNGNCDGSNLPSNAYCVEYYNNTDLAGMPVILTESDSNPLDYTWSGSPTAGVDADNFSVKWAGNFDFVAEGDYIFDVKTSEGFRLYVDDVLEIDKWDWQTSDEYQVSVNLTAGTHKIKLVYFDTTGSSDIELWWESAMCDTAPSGNFCVEFYNTNDLSGSVVRKQKQEPKIDYNSGYDSPYDEVNNDAMSLKAIGDFTFEEGLYIFTINADDGAKFYVDGVLEIDDWQTRGVAEEFTLLKNMTAGTHQIELEYFENTGKSTIDLHWHKPDCTGALNTFCAEYFEFSGTTNFTQDPVLTRDETEVDHEWGSGSPTGVNSDYFNSRWHGSFEFEDSYYAFTYNSDNGMKAWIGGEQIIENWLTSDGEEQLLIKSMTAGTYDIKVKQYEKTGSATAKLTWEKIGCPGDSAGEFTDITESHPFYTYICNLKIDSVIGGYGDGTFKPEEEVTRGAMAKFIMNGFNFAEDTTCGDFPDVPPSHTFYNYITTLKCNGVIGGYPDGTFKPEGIVTRGAAMKFVMNAKAIKEANPDLLTEFGDKSFIDVSISHPFYQYILSGANLSIVGGYGDNTFRPNTNVTRGAMSKIVDNGRSPNYETYFLLITP